MTFRSETEAKLAAAEVRERELKEELRKSQEQLEAEREKSEQIANKKSFLVQWAEQREQRRQHKLQYGGYFFDRWGRPTEPTKIMGMGAGIMGGLALLVFLVMNMPSCSDPIRGGTVTNLFHHHPFITTSVSCTGSGSSRSCTTHVHHHPEKWTVEVCDEGMCIRPQIEESTYNRLHVGEFFCANPPCARHPEREEVYNRD